MVRQLVQGAAAAFFTVTLAGCFPYFTTYVQLSAPMGSASVQAACGGPPTIARYERNGARFEVTLEPGAPANRKQDGYMTVRVPAGVAIAMPDSSAYLAPANGGPRMPFQLVPGLTWTPGPNKEQKYEFRGLPAPIDFAGTLHLPDVLIDGRTVVAPVFTFSREAYAGALPLNC